MSRARVLCVLLLLSACSRPRELVVLLPDTTGHGGQVTVTGVTQSVTLTKPLVASKADAHGKVTPGTVTPETVQAHFGAALGAVPPPRQTFVLYFQTGTTLAEASVADWRALVALLASRPAVEVTVVGYTDRVGSAADNDRLSLARAQEVLTLLAREGVALGLVHTVGRGERQLRVETADEQVEPRNRRVEIDVW